MRALRTTTTVALALAWLCCAGRAHAQQAQTPAELAAGRQLFVEALADEEHGRFADAVTKYKRVLVIRDTPNIRYRIGASLERLGKLVQASESYTAALRAASPGGASADGEVARAAQTRLDAINPRIAHLTVRMTASPAGTEITVDGEPTAVEGVAELAVDPGAHVVAATAPGTRSFRASVELIEGGRADVPIALEPLVSAPPAPPAPSVATHPYRTAGIVTAAAGGVLLIGGVIVLTLRSGAISDLKVACPGGECPASQRDALESKRDRAQTEGPLGVALVGTGVAAAAAGVVLMLLTGSEKGTTARVVPTPIARGAMLTFGGGL